MNFTKSCRGCSGQKPLGQFANSIFESDGLTQYCHQCRGTDEPITEGISLRLTTPNKTWDIAAAAIANDDVGYIRGYVGRITSEDPELVRLLQGFVNLLQMVITE